MNLKQLLDGESLYIDSHQQGDGQPIKYQDLHLHKKMHDSKRSWEIKIYLTKDQVQYGKGFNDNSDKTRQVKNEIEQTFKNNTTLAQFKKDLCSAIESYYNRESLKYKQNVLEYWAKKIAKAFGLKEIIRNQIINDGKKYLTMITSHEDDEGKQYYIKQDTDPLRIPIVVSDDLNELYRRSVSKYRHK